MSRPPSWSILIYLFRDSIVFTCGRLGKWAGCHLTCHMRGVVKCLTTFSSTPWVKYALFFFSIHISTYLVLYIFLIISTTAHSVLLLPVILSSGPRSVCLTAPPLPCAHQLRQRDIFFKFSHSQAMALLLWMRSSYNCPQMTPPHLVVAPIPSRPCRSTIVTSGGRLSMPTRARLHCWSSSVWALQSWW